MTTQPLNSEVHHTPLKPPQEETALLTAFKADVCDALIATLNEHDICHSWTVNQEGQRIKVSCNWNLRTVDLQAAGTESRTQSRASARVDIIPIIGH
jgi:hypothetical protein